jgi:flagellar hook-associated protein 3 FlgL
MIRVSTTTIFERGLFSLQKSQAEVFRTQDQIASGRRVNTPADDPVAAARALDVEQAQAVNQQYIRNSDSAQSALGLAENATTAVTELLQDVRTLAINAGDAALSVRELKSMATELRGRYQELLGLANSTDGNGQYLFSGFQGFTQPFSETAPGTVAYFGDQGARLIQISASRQVPISEAGSDVFQAIKNGNGTFVTEATAANTGTGVVSPGTVTNAIAWNAAGNPRAFSVVFHVDNTGVTPVTTYDIIDTVNNVSLTTGAAPAAAGPYLRTYTEGATIALSRQAPPDTNPAAFDYGATIEIEGAPATGDTFTIQASVNEDMFTTLHNLIVALESAERTATGNARLANDLNTALSNFDRGIDNVLRVRAAIGTRMAETETTQSSQSDLVGQYEDTLSELRDLDYAKAISDLARQQIVYEAAQKSFARVQGLSLFNYI